MSKDPVRLLSDPSCSEARRALLKQGVSLAPPSGAEDRVWRALTATIAPTPTAPPEAPNAPTWLAAHGGRLILAGAVALLAAGAATALRHSRSTVAPAASAQTVPSPTTAEPRPAEPNPAPSTPPQPTSDGAAETAPIPSATGVATAASRTAPSAARLASTPRPATTDAEPRNSAQAEAPAAGTPEAAPPRSQSHLREEVSLIHQARQALQQGNAARALSVLNDSRARFPVAVLTQERELLTIQALAASGRAAEAKGRARSFLDRYPNSPLAKEVAELAR